MSAEYDMHQQTTTKTETDRKCPQCAGVMDFDPVSGGLACSYCGYLEKIAAPEKSAASADELDFYAAESKENFDWGAEKKTVLCKSCGAESIYDVLELSNECPYCGSNHVMEEKGKNTLKPGGVCPFKIDTQQAGALFSVWLKKKLFCPSPAKKKASPSSFKGVYLPYWTFDCNTVTQYTGRYGIDRTVKDSKGNTRTETDWYRTSGVYTEFIDDELVSGTTQHDTSMLKKVEPYNTHNNMAYRPEYVAGFIAERYSVGLRDAFSNAKAAIARKLENAIAQKIRFEHHADHVDVSSMSTNYSNITYKYLLLPIWLSSFTYKNKVFQFMVNGQTGKVGGKAPVSPLRVTVAVVLGIALCLLIAYFVQNS
ncbi:hypothetical protein LJC07_00910 [Christensenellaceae bacterium OttesenSCG-928-L17]|nr:hypothetical protein [Christensenellaceae bacterium OttesenSCG-928-L17]